MPETADEIAALLRQAQDSGPVVREFAWVWLEAFRRDVLDILRQQSLERRGPEDDPDSVRRRTDERLARARLRLKGRLLRLLRWAGEGGAAGR
jgi:hypothetical protein